MSAHAIGGITTNRPVLAIEGLTVSFDGFKDRSVGYDINGFVDCVHSTFGFCITARLVFQECEFLGNSRLQFRWSNRRVRNGLFHQRIHTCCFLFDGT